MFTDVHLQLYFSLKLGCGFVKFYCKIIYFTFVIAYFCEFTYLQMCIIFVLLGGDSLTALNSPYGLYFCKIAYVRKLNISRAM